MDRMEEYRALLDELEEVPPALNYTVQRAKARTKRRRWGRRLGVPLGSMAAAFTAFVLLVNLSMPFALACSNIPFLKQLTAAVAFSPSLEAAVENEYVQILGVSQTDNGVTMTIEHAIVDRKQVNLFFTLRSDDYGELWGHGDVSLPDGGDLPASMSFFQAPEDPNDLWKLRADFKEEDVPDALVLEYEAWPVGEEPDDGTPAPDTDASVWEYHDEEPVPVAHFRFELKFDPQFISQGESLSMDLPFQLDGQQLRITGMEAYPSHVRLDIEEDEGNTALLQDLECWLEDEEGRRYERVSNGISASGKGGSPRVTSYRFESSWFGQAEHLTLHIERASWLDKDMQWLEIDLVTGETGPLPEGVTFLGAERLGSDVILSFRAPMLEEGMAFHQIMLGTYRAPDGTEHASDMHSSTIAMDEDHNEIEGFFDEAFPLRDYPWDTVEVAPRYSRYTFLDEPMDLILK